MSKHEKKGNGLKIFVIVLVVLIILAGGVLAYKILNTQKQTIAQNTNNTIVEEPKEEPKEIKIFNGEDRPIAVMIDNHSGAWPQAGLNDAYMVYEIVVEGGETRLMALFKGKNLDKIGPVRSSRHYFIDYAMENNAIYVHYGWSPQAQSDIKKYNINNINGITESSKNFWRVKDKYAPHNAVTSTENILSMAKQKGYKTTSNEKSVLNYTAEEINLDDGTKADTVTIPHSKLQTVKYTYDSKNKVYKRYARGKAQKDWDSGEPVTTKNIIVMFADNYALNDGSGKDRQGLKNIGTFDGYYITNGKAIKIKCTKKARDEKTVYKDLEGNKIQVNDGNTFVNICPKNANVKIEGAES